MKPPAATPLLTRLRPYRQALESYLADLYRGDSSLHSVARGSILSGGKRIRPILALLSCEAVGGDPQNALPIAAAYELAHNASLIQDDIIDRSDRRRNRLAVHVRHGVGTAILTSDLLIFGIFQRLCDYEDTGLSGRRLYMLLHHLGAAAEATVLGEYLESLHARSPQPMSQDEYLETVRLKTGALMAAAAASGAIAGGGQTAEIKALHLFGERLGIAYQLHDDMLDVFGDADLLGKPILQDFKKGCGNLVLLHALGNATPRSRNAVLQARGGSFTKGEVDAVRELVLEQGSIDHVKTLACITAEVAVAELAKLKESAAREILGELAYSAVNRPA